MLHAAAEPGNRLSRVTTGKGTRLSRVVPSQMLYAPEVSAMPRMNWDIWCQFAEPVAKAWAGHTTSQPELPSVAVMLMLKSAVIPALASAIT